MAKLSKKLKAAYENIDRTKLYGLTEAVSMVKSNANAKFDETIDIAVSLDIDTKQADQMVRGSVSLPNGTGKTFRVAVFAKGPKAEEAQKAGADVVGDEDLMKRIQEGFMDFDRVITTPDLMGVVGRLGKILGPKGLMPNPKLGTVTMDIAGTVKAVKGGQVQYRADDAGVVHAGVGKASFDDAKIVENIKAFVENLNRTKPSGVKGVFIKKISVSSTQGVGVRVDLSSVA